jgi:hypothetical protein
MDDTPRPHTLSSGVCLEPTYHGRDAAYQHTNTTTTVPQRGETLSMKKYFNWEVKLENNLHSV